MEGAGIVRRENKRGGGNGEAREGLRTCFAVSYSAFKYTKTCFVFQLNNGDKSSVHSDASATAKRASETRTEGNED